MNLSYRILWIEDDKDFVESCDTEGLIAYVEEQGFDLWIEYRTTPEEILKEVDGSKYDLMIIDYQIADEERHGSDVIREVRDRKCLTEVIFYSARGASELRQIAADRELEGVFYAGRDRDQLIFKIRDVFDLTVRKVVDVENMRGIVMAGVAELDHLVTDLLRAVHDSLAAELQADLRKQVLAKIRPGLNGIRELVQDKDHGSFAEMELQLNAIVALEPADFDTFANSRSFDSSKRVDMAVSVCKGHAQLKDFKKSILAIKKLLLWRNALAHQRPRVSDGGELLFEPEVGKPEAFDDTCTLKLRKDIKVHKSTLQTAIDRLGGQ